MLISYEESTTGSNNLDGTAGNGLVCTGQGDPGGGSRMVIRSVGIYASAQLTTWACRLKNGATNMRTIDGASNMTGNDGLDGLSIVVPPGWTVEFSTTGASAGCTAWAEYEITGEM